MINTGLITHTHTHTYIYTSWPTRPWAGHELNDARQIWKSLVGRVVRKKWCIRNPGSPNSNTFRFLKSYKNLPSNVYALFTMKVGSINKVHIPAWIPNSNAFRFLKSYKNWPSNVYALFTMKVKFFVKKKGTC